MPTNSTLSLYTPKTPQKHTYISCAVIGQLLVTISHQYSTILSAGSTGLAMRFDAVRPGPNSVDVTAVCLFS